MACAYLLFLDSASELYMLGPGLFFLALYLNKQNAKKRTRFSSFYFSRGISILFRLAFHCSTSRLATLIKYSHSAHRPPLCHPSHLPFTAQNATRSLASTFRFHIARNFHPLAFSAFPVGHRIIQLRLSDSDQVFTALALLEPLHSFPIAKKTPPTHVSTLHPGRFQRKPNREEHSPTSLFGSNFCTARLGSLARPPSSWLTEPGRAFSNLAFPIEFSQRAPTEPRPSSILTAQTPRTASPPPSHCTRPETSPPSRSGRPNSGPTPGSAPPGASPRTARTT